MEAVFLQFLQEYCKEEEALLLALSGGPDSMALFHLLLDARYPFEVAHIDHGWRPESHEEALYLQNLCQSAGISFHMERLIPSSEKKNLEDRARHERLKFYKDVLRKRNLKGVMLAHHADDQAETVLKRLFEGASLPKLQGLLPKIELEGITLYRPLLKAKKSEVLSWLESKNIPFFTDSTNSDPKFLRTRLRKELLPQLSKTFGKEITLNLCRLGESAAELGEFLQECIQPFRDKIQTTQEEVFLDFAQFGTTQSFLSKAIIRDFFDQQHLVLPNAILEAILLHLSRANSRKSLKLGKRTIVIHRKKLILLLCQSP